MPQDVESPEEHPRRRQNLIDEKKFIVDEVATPENSRIIAMNHSLSNNEKQAFSLLDGVYRANRRKCDASSFHQV